MYSYHGQHHSQHCVLTPPLNVLHTNKHHSMVKRKIISSQICKYVVLKWTNKWHFENWLRLQVRILDWLIGMGGASWRSSPVSQPTCESRVPIATLKPGKPWILLNLVQCRGNAWNFILKRKILNLPWNLTKSGILCLHNFLRSQIYFRQFNRVENLEQYHSITCHHLSRKIVISTLKKLGKWLDFNTFWVVATL